MWGCEPEECGLRRELGVKRLEPECFMYLHWQGGACLYTIPLSCVRDLTSPPVAIDISIPYEEKRERTPRGNGAA